MHQDVFGRGFGSDGAPAWACPAENYATFTWTDPWFMNYLSPEVTACFDWLWTTPALWDRYRDAWVHAAAALAGHSGVVGFDLMNEPSPGAQVSFDRAVLGPFYDHVAQGLAGVAPSARLFLEPCLSFNLGVDTRLPAFGAGRVFAPHFYPTFAGSDAYSGDLAQVQEALALHAAAAVRLGAPLVVGELGILHDAAGADRFVADAVDAVLALGGSPVVWALGRGGPGSFALLDESGEPYAVAEALARPYAHRLAGRLVATSYERATRTLEVTWDETGVDAPTEIVLPRAGFAAPQIESSDPPGSWSFELDAAGGRLRLLVDHARARHTFRIAPGP
jgi:endoglycosylceramidase